MAEVIRIDKDVLAAKITQLEALVNEDFVKTYYEKQLVGALSLSSGSSVDTLKEINLELNGIVGQFYLLASRTLDFLKNTHTTFVEADENLASQMGNSDNEGD